MTKFITPIGLASYPCLFKAKKNLNDKLEYSTDILFSKETDITVIKDAVTSAAKAKFGDKMPKAQRYPIKDGDGVKQSGEPYGKEYHGHYFITVKSNRKPGIVDSQNNFIEDESAIYGGCKIRANIQAYAYDYPASKGVSFQLLHVQKAGDGPSFGGDAGVGDPTNCFDVLDTEQDNPANYESLLD